MKQKRKVKEPTPFVGGLSGEKHDFRYGVTQLKDNLNKLKGVKAKSTHPIYMYHSALLIKAKDHKTITKVLAVLREHGVTFIDRSNFKKSNLKHW